MARILERAPATPATVPHEPASGTPTRICSAVASGTPVRLRYASVTEVHVGDIAATTRIFSHRCMWVGDCAVTLFALVAGCRRAQKSNDFPAEQPMHATVAAGRVVILEEFLVLRHDGDEHVRQLHWNVPRDVQDAGHVAGPFPCRAHCKSAQ